jgi:hypothetical protein
VTALYDRIGTPHADLLAHDELDLGYRIAVAEVAGARQAPVRLAYGQDENEHRDR